MIDMPFAEAVDVADIGYRLHPIDVGYDLRAERTPVSIQHEGSIRVSYAAHNGERRVAEGEAALVVALLRSAGYLVVPT